jgi:hypothetical protein
MGTLRTWAGACVVVVALCNRGGRLWNMVYPTWVQKRRISEVRPSYTWTEAICKRTLMLVLTLKKQASVVELWGSFLSRRAQCTIAAVQCAKSISSSLWLVCAKAGEAESCLFWRAICLKDGPGSKPNTPAKLSYETLLACLVGGVAAVQVS